MPARMDSWWHQTRVSFSASPAPGMAGIHSWACLETATARAQLLNVQHMPRRHGGLESPQLLRPRTFAVRIAGTRAVARQLIDLARW